MKPIANTPQERHIANDANIISKRQQGALEAAQTRHFCEGDIAALEAQIAELDTGSPTYAADRATLEATISNRKASIKNTLNSRGLNQL